MRKVGQGKRKSPKGYLAVLLVFVLLFMVSCNSKTADITKQLPSGSDASSTTNTTASGNEDEPAYYGNNSSGNHILTTT